MRITSPSSSIKKLLVTKTSAGRKNPQRGLGTRPDNLEAISWASPATANYAGMAGFLYSLDCPCHLPPSSTAQQPTPNSQQMGSQVRNMFEYTIPMENVRPLPANSFCRSATKFCLIFSFWQKTTRKTCPSHCTVEEHLKSWPQRAVYLISIITATPQGQFRTHFIQFVEFNAFFLAAASSNRRHIQHPISEFNESTPREEKGPRSPK